MVNDPDFPKTNVVSTIRGSHVVPDGTAPKLGIELLVDSFSFTANAWFDDAADQEKRENKSNPLP